MQITLDNRIKLLYERNSFIKLKSSLRLSSRLVSIKVSIELIFINLLLSIEVLV